MLVRSDWECLDPNWSVKLTKLKAIEVDPISSSLFSEWDKCVDIGHY
jgi:hypothetical protein